MKSYIVLVRKRREIHEFAKKFGFKRFDYLLKAADPIVKANE